MKNYEFQVGDYVLHYGKVIKIEAAHLKKVGYHNGRRDKLTWVRVSELQPIELTKDFLDWAFEFNELDTVQYNFEDEYAKIFYFAPNKRMPWNFVWIPKTQELLIEDDPLIRMNYIHQLQHVLREIGNTYIIDYETYRNSKSSMRNSD